MAILGEADKCGIETAVEAVKCGIPNEDRFEQGLRKVDRVAGTRHLVVTLYVEVRSSLAHWSLETITFLFGSCPQEWIRAYSSPAML